MVATRSFRPGTTGRCLREVTLLDRLKLGLAAGVLCAATGAPVAAHDRACATAGGSFLYVISGGVFGFQIGSDGPLATLPGSPFGSGFAFEIATPPFRPHAYLPASFQGVRGLAIDPATGALSELPGSPFGAGPAPITAALHPSGGFLYVGDNFTGEIRYYTVSPEGSLTLQGVIGTGGIFGPGMLAFDPEGRFLYAFPAFVPGVLGYAIDPITGALQPLPGSPFSGPMGGQNKIAVTTAGRFVVVTNGSMVSVYATLPDGALELVDSMPAGRAEGLAVDPTGQYVYVVNPFAEDFTDFMGRVRAFRLDPETGRLSIVPGSPFSTGGVTSTVAAVDASGRFLYVVNQGFMPTPPGSVSALAIDQSTGALSKVTGSPFAAGDRPFSLTTWQAAPPVVPEGLWPPLAALVPAGNPPPLPDRVFEVGSTLPLKLRLLCGDGAPPKIDALLLAGERLNLDELDLDSGQSAGARLKFRGANLQWTYNLQTRDLVAGSYTVRLRMGDGSLYDAAFVLR